MIEVYNPGLFTSVQDKGRFSYRDFGVPVSGVMDEISANNANLLVGNSSDAAVLEITLVGPTLKFHQSAIIACCGASIALYVNGNPIKINNAYTLRRGDLLECKKIVNGCRSYLAISGGINTKEVLGSRSFYFPVTSQSRLMLGDSFSIGKQKSSGTKKQNTSFLDINANVIEVYPGPEFSKLSFNHLEQLFAKKLSISAQNNRMGYQLSDNIGGIKESMITAPTLPGTIQLTPAGKLIILMKDAQTTGGYPRILQLSKSSVFLLAQKKFEDRIQFRYLG